MSTRVELQIGFATIPADYNSAALLLSYYSMAYTDGRSDERVTPRGRNRSVGDTHPVRGRLMYYLYNITLFFCCQYTFCNIINRKGGKLTMKRKQRADGRYQAKIRTGTVDGKPQYKYVYASTQKELNDKLAELRVEIGKGADLTQPMSLAFWIDRWLARSEQTQTASWYEICEARAEYWKAALGREDISRITTTDLEDVLLELSRCNPKTGKPSSKKTLNEYTGVIRRVFALAVRSRVLTYDPTQYLIKPQNAPKYTRSAISDADIAKIREAPHECRLPCLLMIYAGLRWGEVAALTWSDVDLTNLTISVNKSYDFKQQTVKLPKTAAGVRMIPIPEILADVLRQEPRTSLLVCTHGGKLWTNSSWKFAFDKYIAQLGIQTTTHCLRHTYCTILYEAGVDVLTAQKWMGHADSATTMGIYTHLRDQKQAASIAQLNAHLTPKKEQDGVNRVSE